MKLLADPSQKKDPGELLPIPAYLQKTVPGWAGADYRQYDFGYLLIQEFFSKRFSIYIWKIMIQHPVLLYPCSDKPTLNLQFTIRGNIPCVLKGFGKKLLLENHYELFYVPKGENQTWFEPGDYESLHIELNPSFLRKASENYPRVKALLEKLAVDSDLGESLAAGRMDYRVKGMLNHLRERGGDGDELIGELQKNIEELLNYFLAELKRIEIQDTLPKVFRRETLIRIREQVLQNPNMREQTLLKLSQEHLIPMTMLKRNFKVLFGQNLLSFIRVECLKKAKWLLSTTDRSVKDIVDEIGYKDKSNFAKAFRREFGKAPNAERSTEDSMADQ
jgi:AraC-like DNA-binding protein